MHEQDPGTMLREMEMGYVAFPPQERGNAIYVGCGHAIIASVVASFELLS